MANKRYYGVGGKTGGKAEAKFGCGHGTPMPTTAPEKTAAWPGVPGKTQPRSRANGMPTTGYAGPFNFKKEGF